MDEDDFPFETIEGMDERGFPFEPIEGMDEAAFPFETIEDSAISAFNLEQNMMDYDEHTLGICEEGIEANGVSDLNGRGAPRTNGETERRHSEARGRVILVKLGECTKRIGIDGSPEAIKDAIKSAFGPRIRRPFWLEDEDGVVRTLDRDMPLGTYTLHLDEGLRTKICQSTHPNHVPCRAEEKSFYTQADFSAFLVSRGWIGLKGSRCNWTVDSLDVLKSDEVYHGVGMVNINST